MILKKMKMRYANYSLLEIYFAIEDEFLCIHTDESVIRVCKLYASCKNTWSLTEKCPIIKDVETRYRYRYVDLIMNKDKKETFRKKSKIFNVMKISIW